MSDFSKSYEKVMGSEGGYSFSKDDLGGETYKGISRRFNPDWDGWVIIDSLKSVTHDFSKSPELEEKVVSFYKSKYWNSYCGDSMPQELGDEMFDCAVNLGVQTSVKYLQRALTVLNRNNPSWYPDLVDDGVCGANTLFALGRYLKKDSVALLVKILNVQQGMHYMEFMKKSPVQEVFARGWFSRVTC